jgi:hypothetical protein
MTQRTGSIARILAVAGAVVLAAVSCPNPIDRELLLRVDDGIAPDLTITAPTAFSYYHGIMGVTGVLADSSSVSGDGQGRIHTLSFSVSDESPLGRTVTFDSAGTATVSPADPSFAWDSATGSFSFDVDMLGVQNYKVLRFVASDANGNATQRSVDLLPYPYGPHLDLTSPEDLSIYGLVVTIEGTATNAVGDATTDEVEALRCEVTGKPDHDLVLGPGTWDPVEERYESGSLTYDPASGEFSDWYNSSSDSGTLFAKVSAQNASLVWSSVTVQLAFHGTGPAITLAPAAAGHNPAEYSSKLTTAITVDGTVDISNLEAGSVHFIVTQPAGYPRTGLLTPDGVTGAFSFTFSPGVSPKLSDNLTIEVSARDNRGITSTESYPCYDDITAPDPPEVSGTPSPTNDNTPTWTWDTPATTNDFQYSAVGALGPWTTTAGTSYTPAAPLDDGRYSLWVRARDALGNPSSTDSYSLTVDTDPPSAPTVNAPASPTNDDTPTWSWNRPTNTVEFRCSLVSDTGPWTTTAALSWTASPPLDPDDPYTDYTLYVQGRDEAGNWSPAGSDTVRVDTTPPPAPTVTGTVSPTTDQTPTWTWNTPGDATGFRRSLDNPDPATWTTDNSNDWTASPALNAGSHTLYVQARDAVGNWSASGSYTVIIEEP